jgi:hypothetical protein
LTISTHIAIEAAKLAVEQNRDRKIGRLLLALLRRLGMMTAMTTTGAFLSPFQNNLLRK